MIADRTTSLGGPTARQVDLAVRSALAEFRDIRQGRIGSSEEHEFTGRLFSLANAEALEAKVRAVRIAPGTVITPMARDSLKRNGIAVRFVARGEQTGLRNTGDWGIAIERTCLSGLVEAWRRKVLSGDERWDEVGETLDQATRWVLGAGGRGALMLTDEASRAVYQACRVSGIRAASAEEPNAVARAIRSIGVNLLVVEPAGKSIAWLAQIGTTFRRAGGPIAPGGLS
jgi:hypothetical protein